MIIPVLLLLLPRTISAQSAGEHRVIQSEIDGVPLVRTEGGPKYGGPLFETEIDLVLGIDEGEPEWQMFWVSPLFLVSPDGRMVLIDHRRCEIFIVSREGELITRTGGSGSGPGEFRQPWFYYWDVPGEEFLIEDRALNRITRFSMAGEFLGTLNYGQIQNREYRYFHTLGNGRYLGYDYFDERPPVEGQPIEGSKKFCFLDSDLQFIEDFIELRHRASFATSEYSGSLIPFAREPDIVTFPDTLSQDISCLRSGVRR